MWTSLDWSTCVPPVAVGILTAPCALTWQQKCHHLTNRLLTTIQSGQYTVQKVYLEYPAFYQSMGGQVVAKSGALVKLAYCVGVMAGAIYHGAHCDVELVPVAHWKGQLPKDVVARRIGRLLGPAAAPYRSHIFDAVGIGLWAKGFFR